jgi:hypothetical protein
LLVSQLKLGWGGGVEWLYCGWLATRWVPFAVRPQ